MQPETDDRPMTDPEVDVSVVVLTYDRNALLARTLATLAAQHNALGLRREIIVVDNHPERRAEPVARLGATCGIALHYVCDPTRNLSALRNVGVRAARGTFVAFIDDDEAADPDWLDALIGCLRRTGADIALGPRLAELGDGATMDPARRDEAIAAYTRDFGLAPDGEMILLSPLGKPRYGVGMGNSAVRADRCLAAPAPFDPSFGTAGGEDTAFFSQQFAAGRRIVWAAGARVTERVPAHRTEPGFRLRRICRESQIYGRAYLHNTQRRLRVRAELAAVGTVQVVLGAALTLATVERGPSRPIKWRAMVARGLGKLTWGRPLAFVGTAKTR